MKRVNRQKHAGTLASLAAALLCWFLFSVLALFIIWGWRDRARLIRDNGNEQIFNALFAGFRDYDDAASAIKENETLRENIAGFAVYDNNGALLQQWGGVPQTFDPSLIAGQTPNRFNRYTFPDRRSASVRFVIHNERPRPPPAGSRQFENSAEAGRRESQGPAGEYQNRRSSERRFDSPWSSLFARGNYVYINIRHPAYWRTMAVTGFLKPFLVIVLLALALGIRRLYLRTVEYRERIEAQQNLVVLGTAAGTLAHEIKNPLHSIKLQTGILKKILDPAAGKTAGDMPPGLEEAVRIDEEVDRLSALTYRINDYLRDSRGNPETINIVSIIEETSRRLCGRSILEKLSAPRLFVIMDSGRARSVFENIITNTLEAGGPAEDCGALARVEGQSVIVTIYDRGRGAGGADLKRIFDPFFTTKSSGTGIGLAVSKRFVEAAGGNIVLENRDGGGALVRITLPSAG